MALPALGYFSDVARIVSEAKTALDDMLAALHGELALLVTNASYRISGGTAGDGGNIIVYGSTHATKANDFELRSGSSVRLGWDDSQNRIDCQGEDIFTTGTLTCGALTSAGIDDNATSLALTIDSSELFKVGQTSGDEGHVFRNDGANTNAFTVINAHATLAYGMIVKLPNQAGDTTRKLFEGQNSGGAAINIYSNGNIVNTNNSYGAISDAALKRDVERASPQWEDVKALGKKGRRFRMKTDVAQNPDAPFMLGLIAQDVEKISPGLVDDTRDMILVEKPAVDDDGKPVMDIAFKPMLDAAGQPQLDEAGKPVMDIVSTPKVVAVQEETGGITKTIKYSVLYMKAFFALGEAMERIEDLEASNADLLGRVEALEAKLT